MTGESTRRAPGPERPTIAELRRVCQPPSITGRRNAEHWTGDLYMRRISPYLTRVLLRLGFRPNGVTGLMILSGCGAAAALLVPGMWGPVLAVLLTQLQMLWDASDGEVARWRGMFSPAGVFLDKVGHYAAESLIPVALGVRVAGGLGGMGDHYGWTTLGLALGMLLMFNKALNDMVHVARAHTGLDRLPDTEAVTAPRQGLLARLRRVARYVPFHRIFHSVELSLIILVVALIGLGTGEPTVLRPLLLALLAAAALAVLGHLVAILTSSRVRNP